MNDNFIDEPFNNEETIENGLISINREFSKSNSICSFSPSSAEVGSSPTGQITFNTYAFHSIDKEAEESIENYHIDSTYLPNELHYNPAYKPSRQKNLNQQ